MISALRKTALLTAKDLRIEARSRQTLGLVIVLGVLIIVVLGLGLGMRGNAAGYGATASSGPSIEKESGSAPGDGAEAKRDVADYAAILWVAYVFGGVLCFEKTMAVERQDGALAALLAAPVDRGIIFAGKLLSNLVLIFALAAVVTPAAIVLFDFDLSAAPGSFAIVTGLSMLGFASVGTLFAAATSSSRLQGGLLAMLVFPICLPVVVASTQILVSIFRDGKALGGDSLGVLVAFDVVYLVVSWLAFEWLLEP